MTGAPSKFWPTPSLLRSLSRAGWGELAGAEFQGIRSTLLALSASLPDRKARGLATACQIADRAGLSERWARRCLGVLEDLGVLEWKRGGIDPETKTPMPGFFRLIKARLVELIEEARGVLTTRLAKRRAETALRLASARRFKKPERERPGESVRNSVQAFTPFKGVVKPQARPSGACVVNPSPINGIVNLERKERIVMDRPMIPPNHQLNQYLLALPCPHETYGGRYRCGQCRFNAMSDEQLADYYAQEAAYKRYVRGF